MNTDRSARKDPGQQVPVDTLSYEQALNELSQIVAALESEEKDLAESLELFQRGQELSQYCARLLDQAELKVQQITGEDLVDFKG